MPVEDSQDLYAPPSPGESGPQGRFSLEEDTQSQDRKSTRLNSSHL